MARTLFTFDEEDDLKLEKYSPEEYSELFDGIDPNDALTTELSGEDPNIAAIEKTSVVNLEDRLSQDLERSDLINAADEDLRSNLAKYRESAAESLEDSGVSSGQITGVGITTILPILIGAALAGKKGAYAGAESGLKGAGIQLALDKQDVQKEQARSSKRASEYLQLAKESAKEKQGLQREQIRARERAAQTLFKEKGKDRRAKEVSGQDKGEPYSSGGIKSFEGPIDIITSAQNALNEITKASPELRKRITREDGSVDWANAGEALVDQIQAGIFGSSTELSKVKSAGRRFLSDYQYAVSGAALSDKEREWHRKNILGDGLILDSDLPTMFEIIRKVQDSQVERLKTRVKLRTISGEGGEGRAEDVLSFVDQIRRSPERLGTIGEEEEDPETDSLSARRQRLRDLAIKNQRR